MSNSLSAVGQLAAMIRLQMARQLKAPAGTKKAALASRKPAAEQGAAQASALEARISERVRQISPDDPKRGNKAFRVFLEQVLLSQFGDQLINDPAFYEMLDELQDAMENDAATKDLVAEATRYLLVNN